MGVHMFNLLLFLVILGAIFGAFVVGFGGLKQVFKGDFKQGFKTIGIGLGILVVSLIIFFAKIISEQPTPEEQKSQEQEEKAEEQQQAKFETEEKAKKEAEAKAEAERQAQKDAIIQDLMYVKQQYSGRAKVHKDEDSKAFIIEFNDESYMTTIVQQASVGNVVAGGLYNQEVKIATNVSKGINPEWKIRVVTGEFSMWKGYSYHIEVQEGKRDQS